MKEQEIKCPICQKHTIPQEKKENLLNFSNILSISITTIPLDICDNMLVEIELRKPLIQGNIKFNFNLSIYQIKEGDLKGFYFLFKIKIKNKTKKLISTCLSYDEANAVLTEIKTRLITYRSKIEEQKNPFRKKSSCGRKELSLSVTEEVKKIIHPFFKTLRKTTEF